MTIEGQLEIDLKRGVVYFHSAASGGTVLRVCRLEIPKSFNPDHDMINITHMVGVSYVEPPNDIVEEIF